VPTRRRWHPVCEGRSPSRNRGCRSRCCRWRRSTCRISRHDCEGCAVEHEVLEKELSHQVEQGEARHCWGNEEDGQRPNKQHHGQQTDIAHPQTSDQEHAGNDFKGAEHIDERAEGQETERHREHVHDRFGVAQMQGPDPDQDQAQANAQSGPGEPFDQVKMDVMTLLAFWARVYADIGPSSDAACGIYTFMVGSPSCTPTRTRTSTRGHARPLADTCALLIRTSSIRSN
jgi:hypothetical protein